MSDAGINWGEVLEEAANDTTTQVAPDGPYSIRVASVEVTTTSTDGSPMLKVVSDIIDGPFKGKRLWDNIVLKASSPRAMRISLQNLAALGVSKEWLASANPSTQQIAEALTGAEATAIVGNKVWKGETRNEIKKYQPAGAADGVPPAPSVPSPAAPAPSAAPAAPPAPDVPPTPSVPSGEEPF